MRVWKFLGAAVAVCSVGAWFAFGLGETEAQAQAPAHLRAQTSSVVTARSQTEVQTLWTAQWITSPDGPQRDASVLHFRRVLRAAVKPEHFLVQVSADNQFLLYVNGVRVGSGPSRSGLGHWRYETYDLAPMMRAGANVLAATVWNFGVLTPLAQISDRTGFVLQGEGEAERGADTGAAWQVEEEKGVELLPTPPAVRHHYYVAEPAERIDGRVFDWRWNSEESAGGSWKNAQPIGRATLLGSEAQENNWQLMADPLPAMESRVDGPGKVVRVAGAPAAVALGAGLPEGGVTLPAHTKATILLDNTHLTTAYPEVTVSGGRGATVRLTYAEALFDDAGMKGNRNEIAGKHIVGIFDEFVADGSANRTFEPLGWKTWRYLQVDIETGDEPLNLKKLESRFTAYPFEERGRFAANDSSLGAIWEIGWRTARLDAHDTYMDTPYYERMQYIGDTRIQALISYAVAGDDRLARQAIEAFNDSRIPEGVTRSRYPSSVRQIIPPFSLLWVGMVHDFWMYRNDDAFVREQLAGTRTVLSWFMARQRGDGLLGRIAWWPFVDWGKDFAGGDPPQDADGGSAVITLQFVEALRNAAEMDKALGETAQAAAYSSAAQRAAEAVYRLCWNRQYGLLADTPAQTHFSQHANILGVWLDVIPKPEQKEVLTKILSTTDAGFNSSTALPAMTAATYYFRFYLARALDHAGMGDRYLELLGLWHEMVEQGLTTWAEQPEPTRSDSHAWSAHPNYDLLTIVAGIRPDGPGFQKVLITPQPGQLQHVTAAMPTPAGSVAVEYTRIGAALKAVITLPAGLPGELVWQGKSVALHAGPQEMRLPLP